MSEPIHGILFDMDDTLIDWHGFKGNWYSIERRHLQAVHAYLAEKGCALTCSLERLAQVYQEQIADAWEKSRITLRAPNVPQIMHAVLSQFGYHEQKGIPLADVLVAYNWQGAEDVVVFPDVHAGLTRLREMGFKLGIVTNAAQPMWMRDAELRQFDLLQFFPDQATRISAGDVGYLKPHKRIFKHALQQLGTNPENTLYVGDNPVADISGAQAVSMRAILRVNHGKYPSLNRLITPDAVITHFDDLVTLVSDWDQQVAHYRLDHHS